MLSVIKNTKLLTVLTLFYSSTSIAGEPLNEIGCLVSNNNYIQGEEKLFKLPSMRLTTNTSTIGTVFENSSTSIQLASSSVIHATMKPALVSSFKIIVLQGSGSTIEVKSASRRDASESISTHLTLRKNNKELIIECNAR